ncbi:MAG: hypothetical protein KF914_09920 [Rhizobiaceae bacterium]|nr:hypothetical protein [Rhizobiaceae bacterium]
MAKVSFANLDEQFSFVLERYAVYNGGTLEVASIQFWSWLTANGHDVDFAGLDLAFDGGDAPTGGTLKQLTLDLDNDGFATGELRITDLSVSAKDLAPLVNGGLTDEQQENLFWRTVLAGNDEIDFTGYAGNDPIDFSADGRVVEANQTLFGGDDIFIGSAGKDNSLSGDYVTVEAGGSAHGGDDIFAMTVAGSIYGDFTFVSGVASGGHDRITVEAGNTFGAAYGDAFGVNAGGVLAGGNDTLMLSGTSPSPHAGIGDAYVVDGQLIGGDDTIIGSDQGEALLGDANEVRATGVLRGGNDVIRGGGGGDTLHGDWITVVAGGKAIGGNDDLFGEAGDDTLFGNGGNDRLEGGADKDDHFGGDGNDTLVISAVTDVVVGETYDGGGGKDTLLLSIAGSFGLGLNAVTLKDIEALTFADPGANKTASALLAATQIGSGLASDATITGNGFGDVTNTLQILFGAVHADIDLSKLKMVDFDQANDSVVIAANANSNIITGTSVRDEIIAGGGVDTLNGGDGDDTLDGGEDDDKMNGGTGDDTYLVDSNGDVIVEVAGEGTGDHVMASASFDLLEDVDVELLSTTDDKGTSAINLYGNTLKQTITGNAGANLISDGGKGAADVLMGLGGDDTYRVYNSGDTIVEGAAEGANDTVLVNVSFDLLEGVYIETFGALNQKSTASLNLYGNTLAQEITGNAGKNIISDGGKGAADVLKGLAGDDTYRVYNSGTVVVESAGQGLKDTVQAAVSYTLKAGVEVEVLTTTSASGKSAISLYGNEFGQTITGNKGANALRGYDGDDTINGGDGADKISGGLGNDTLAGNAGADTYYFSYALDEATNVDTIKGFSSIDLISLSASIFTQAGPAGALAASAFRANTTGKAGDASDRIIWETDTGKLYYDPDGTGAAAGTTFAIITGNTGPINAGDFVIA